MGPRSRQLRSYVRTLARLDPAISVAVLLQWLAAVYLASLLQRDASLHAVTRMGMIAVAVLSGPATFFSLVRTLHRLRTHRYQREHLLHCAHHDPLTGLPNRAAMQTFFTALLHRARRDSYQIQCLYLDMDGMRHANTLLGYRAGDELLQQVVSRVANCLNPMDHFSRFGGDKFVILLHRPISRPELNALAECLIHSAAHPQQLDGREFVMSVSIGIASFPNNQSVESILSAAERAMYSAKLAGRDLYRYAEQAENTTGTRSHMLAEKLQRALQTQALRLVYQPIFDRAGNLVAAEALARWHDPEDGNISPAEFIPIAEETGLIVPLSTWALRCACTQMQNWRSLGAQIRRIAVNICVLQVSRQDFVSTVKRVLRDTGLPPECLELEVTEGALARDFAAVKEHLQHLRHLGVRISIDDFGTGYSSFGRLRDLSADTLKIDRIFVQGAHETPNGIAVLQALIDMAHTLNLSVVAEGVETAEQLDMLRALKCDEIQGFLLARPQEAHAMPRLLFAPALQVAESVDFSVGQFVPGFA